MMRQSPMKPGAPMKRTAFARGERKEAGAVAMLRNAKPKRRTKATTAERAHLVAVAALGCILCQHLDFGPTPAEVHHVRKRHGWGRSGHFATIPLCPTHHRGQPFGVHDMGRAQFTEYYGISEIDLLGVVMRRLNLSEAEPVAADTTSKQNPHEEIYV